jgi:hypothetical protein
LQLLLVGKFRKVQRQRPVRTEKPEETDEYFPWLTAFSRTKGFQSRRRKCQRRTLPEPDPIFTRIMRGADPPLRGTLTALKQPDRTEEIEREWRLLELLTNQMSSADSWFPSHDLARAAEI